MTRQDRARKKIRAEMIQEMDRNVGNASQPSKKQDTVMCQYTE